MMKLQLITIALTVALFLGSCAQEASTSEEGVSSKNSYELVAVNAPSSIEDAFTTVDQLPLFAGCKEMKCSNTELINFVQKHLHYPEDAKDKGIEGKAIIQFIVETDGSVSNIIAKRDPGHGLGQSAMKMVQKMNENNVMWTSGVHQDKKVPVLLTLPVTYRI